MKSIINLSYDFSKLPTIFTILVIISYLRAIHIFFEIQILH